VIDKITKIDYLAKKKIIINKNNIYIYGVAKQLFSCDAIQTSRPARFSISSYDGKYRWSVMKLILAHEICPTTLNISGE
jgi:hypothetical protein